MEKLHLTYWAADTEGRIDALLLLWEHLKSLADIAKYQGNCPVRISVRAVRSSRKPGGKT